MSIQGEVVRGSIVWLKLLPKVGNEQAAYRAAIVLSDGFIRSFSNSKLAFIVPITTKVKNTPFEVPAPTGSDVIPLVESWPNTRKFPFWRALRCRIMPNRLISTQGTPSSSDG
jgi:mRNA-degrading endonuclease toxin of MazEF toxin-antitoxin module